MNGGSGPEALKAVDLCDDLDLPVAGVGEHRVGLVVGTWTELPNAAVASEEVLDGRGRVVPFPVTPHGIIAPAARSICELDLNHRLAR